MLGAQNARAIAGGTDLLALMKDGILDAARVVDPTAIPGLDAISEVSGELRIGTLAKLADIADSRLVKDRAPALAHAAFAVASPQIRNMGTLGGNLAQKVRCWYFRDPDRSDCYKRNGSFCYAVLGGSDLHAIFDGAACFAVQPSDTATALSALNATIVVASPSGTKEIGVDDFFVGPHTDYHRETALAPDELITEVRIPASSLGARSAFVKWAPRKTIDFARASAAVFVDARPIGTARVALGGVAPTPHRALDTESFLAGKQLSADTIRQAAELAVNGARPLASNDYKVQLVQGLVRQALATLA